MSQIRFYKYLRIILNLLFFIFFVITSFNKYNKDVSVFLILTFQVIMFIPAWLHVFIILPELNKKKNFLIYFISIISTLILGIFFLGSFLQLLQSLYENSDIGWFTSLAITASSPDFLSNYQIYFDVLPDTIILTTALTFGYVIQAYFLEIIKQKQILNEHEKAELAILKSQISPHFLFNVLNSIYSLSLSKSDQISDVVLQLSDILRYTLYNTEEKEVSLQNEIQIIESYIAIEKIRISDTVSIDFNYNKVDTQILIAPLLLLPLIENAFKHGVDSTIEASFIQASLNVKDKKLLFNCKNNFKEIEKNNSIDGGIGLRNIERRLQLLYPNKFTFEYKKSENIFEVNLLIELN